MPAEAAIEIELRWRDLDMLGHVNQSVYHELLEEARAALIRSLDRQFAFVLVRVELDHLAEVRRDHSPITATCRVTKVGEKSITVENEVVRNDGTTAARGTSVLVAWDPRERTSRALTADERDALRAA